MRLINKPSIKIMENNMPRRRVEVTLSEIEELDIKERLWNGEVITDIAQLFNVPRSTVASIKRGDRAYYVLWPSGERGSMPIKRAAIICEASGGRGYNKDMQQKLGLVATLGDLKDETIPEGEDKRMEILERRVDETLRLLRDARGMDIQFSLELARL